MTGAPRHVIFGTGAVGLATLDALRHLERVRHPTIARSAALDRLEAAHRGGRDDGRPQLRAALEMSPSSGPSRGPNARGRSPARPGKPPASET